jgi:hypothetical protein
MSEINTLSVAEKIILADKMLLDHRIDNLVDSKVKTIR